MKAADFEIEHILSGKPSRMPLRDYERIKHRLPPLEVTNPSEAPHASGGTWTWVTVRLVNQ